MEAVNHLAGIHTPDRRAKARDMDDDARLVRIEAKVDKLSEAMVEIVRLEASQASVSKRVDRIDTVLDNRIQHKLDDLDARVNRVDSLKSQTEGRSSTIE